jgi:inosine-uridine nucleoside N-ribohydrolase
MEYSTVLIIIVISIVLILVFIQLTKTREPVVIITDIANGLRSGRDFADIDDAYAVYMALEKCKKFNILSIIVQFGNFNDVPAMMEKLEDLMKHTDTSCKPLLVEGSSVPYSPGNAPKSLDETIELIKMYPTPVKILCFSPGTDAAYIMDSPAKHNVSRVYLEMGQSKEWEDSCGFEVCNTPVGDFNFFTDIDATQALIDQNAPITFVPFQVILNIHLTHLDLRNFIDRTGYGWFHQWTNSFPCESYIHLWDVAVVRAALSKYKTVPCTAEILSCKDDTGVMHGVMTHRIKLTETSSSNMDMCLDDGQIYDWEW